MKKILKISLYILLGIVLVLLTTIHIIYHSFSPGDEGIEVNNTNLAYYHDSYIESRNAFLDEAKNLVGQFEQAELFSIPNLAFPFLSPWYLSAMLLSLDTPSL